MKQALLAAVLLLAAFHPPGQAGAGRVAFSSPLPRQALQGLVTITGSSEVEGFASAEVAFAYAGDPTGTWFLIAAADSPVSEGILAVWDTTAISDGDYVLRLRVRLSDGAFRDAIVPDLRVRNYTPVETPTPAPTAQQATPVPSATPSASPHPTPTPLPPNPAGLTPAGVWAGVFYGGAAAVLLFALIGLYLWLRQK